MENLAKPHLAEVLGVEVEQKWRVVCPEEGINSVEVWLNEKGQLIGVPAVVGASILLTAINHPECIIRTRHLTEPELAICNVHHAAYVTAGKYNKDPWIHLWNGKPREIDGDFFGDEEGETEIIAWVNKKEFPSVHPGDCICVEEVSSE